MRAQLDELDKLSSSDRTEDRAVYVAMWAGLLERRPDRVIAAAARTARTYFDDSIIASPKSWGTALAYQMQGKANTAEVEWKAAETVMRQRLREIPGNPTDVVRLAATLAWLGREEEAARESATVEPSMKERLNPFNARLLAMYYAARGDAAGAVPYLRAVLNKTSFLTDRTLAIDPWWQKLRGKLEFEALLAEAKARIASGRGSEVNISPSLSSPPSVDSKSVAVLAFTNLSDDKGNEYFSDGISEELLNVLAKIPGLKVSARTSAFFFKGKQVPVPEIAEKLGVAYVVEGSVRKVGNRVRITAQLIKAADGFHVWSDNFDRELKDIFALQDEIAGLIANNLSLKLGATSRTAKSIDSEAYRLYREGRHFWSQRSFDGFDRAEVALTKALTLEPQSALLHAGLADVHVMRGWNRQVYGLPPADDFNRARPEAELALALDPEIPEVYAAPAAIALLERQWAEAERLIRKSLALTPSDAAAYNRLGDLMVERGRLDVALENYQRATQLDPLSLYTVRDAARFHFNARRYRQGIEIIDRFEAVAPGDLRLAIWRAGALIALGKIGQAAVELKAVVPRVLADDNPGAAGGETVFFLREAKCEPESEALATALLARYRTDSPFNAIVYAARGRNDEAIAALKVFPTGNVDRLFWGRVFDALREDPRFTKKLAASPYAAEYKVARETLTRMLAEQETTK